MKVIQPVSTAKLKDNPKRMTLYGYIQARMGSTRLPGKVMLDLAGRPLIQHISDRLKKVKNLEGIILATTVKPENDILCEFADKEGLLVYREEKENDHCERMYNSLEVSKADAILRINADCPLIDINLLNTAVEYKVEHPFCDYVSNKQIFTYPIGLSFEIISKHAIQVAHRTLKSEQDRQLAANWIKDSDLFSKYLLRNDTDMSSIGLTVDTQEDFEEVSRLFEKYYKDNPYFGLIELKEHYGGTYSF